MTLSDILFILYLNMIPLGLIVMGCFILYSFVIYEHNRMNNE